MTNKYMKKCSTSLAIEEIQMKTTLRFHLIPVILVIMEKTTNNKCWIEYGEKKPLYIVNGYVNWYNQYQLTRNQYGGPQKKTLE
jgi:hypothetical protein